MTTTTHPLGAEATTVGGIPTGPGDQLAHALKLLREFDVVMLLSYERQHHGGLHSSTRAPRFHARPMTIAAIDNDCTLWFVTSIDSTNVEEAISPNDGYAVAQTKTRQASIRGTFTVVRDPDQIKAVWKKDYEAWFPEGPTGARVCLLGLHAREVEFWDASATTGLKYLLDAAKAFMVGETPKPRHEEHERLHIG